MKNNSGILLLALTLIALFQVTPSAKAADYASDAIPTMNGELRVTPMGHATFMLQFGGKVIGFDPAGKVDVTSVPKADVVFITDVHGDHMDRAVLDSWKKPGAVVVAPASVAKTITEAQAINNGETKTIAGLTVEAIPMYNNTRGPEPGKLFHDKGRGNGYVVTLGGKRIYVAGDTECTAEMKALKNIDIAFVPMNLPYTMTTAEAADCVKAFAPKIVYPYHSRGSKVEEFADALKVASGVEVRVRTWY